LKVFADGKTRRSKCPWADERPEGAGTASTLQS